MTRQPQNASNSAIGRWWDNLVQRERRMVVALAATVILVSLIVVGMIIRNGLDKRRKRNAMLHDAIQMVDRGRDAFDARKRKEAELNAIIGTESPVLATYLEAAASKAGVTIPESTERPATAHGKYTEKSVDLKLRGVTLEQLANFLKNVEESQVVVVQRLQVKTYFNQHERLDVELTVATYERAKVVPKKPAKPDAKPESEDKEITG
jgi:type II secretory pathway component PulM